MDEWWTIEEAPNYEINEEGHVRHKASKKCLKHRDDGVRGDDPYVILRVNGQNISRSVYVLLRTTQITRRQ